MTLINLVNLIIGGNVWFKISTVRKSNGINSHRLYGGFMDPTILDDRSSWNWQNYTDLGTQEIPTVLPEPIPIL